MFVLGPRTRCALSGWRYLCMHEDLYSRRYLSTDLKRYSETIPTTTTTTTITSMTTTTTLPYYIMTTAGDFAAPPRRSNNTAQCLADTRVYSERHPSRRVQSSKYKQTTHGTSNTWEVANQIQARFLWSKNTYVCRKSTLRCEVVRFSALFSLCLSPGRLACRTVSTQTKIQNFSVGKNPSETGSATFTCHQYLSERWPQATPVTSTWPNPWTGVSVQNATYFALVVLWVAILTAKPTTECFGRGLGLCVWRDAA